MNSKQRNLKHRRRVAAAVACAGYPGSYASTDDKGRLNLRRPGLVYNLNPYSDWTPIKGRFGGMK